MMKSKIEGYPKLAALMSQSPGMAIFRQLSEINILSLLSLQAEVTALEDELKERSSADKGSPDPARRLYHINFTKMKEASADGDELQWLKLLGLRDKLNDYSHALLQVAQIHQLSSPKKYDLDFLTDWLERPGLGDNFLQSLEDRAWSEENAKDIVAVSNRKADSDALTDLISDRICPWLFARFGIGGDNSTIDKAELGVAGKDDETFNQVASLTSMIISSLLPVVCITILYFMQNPLLRLVLILVFTMVFAVTITLVAKARRVEIFAACAAFAAVQVVFVGCAEMKVPPLEKAIGISHVYNHIFKS